MQKRACAALKVNDLASSLTFYKGLGCRLIESQLDADRIVIDLYGTLILLAGPAVKNLSTHLDEPRAIYKPGDTFKIVQKSLDECHATLTKHGLTDTDIDWGQTDQGDRKLSIRDGSNFTINFVQQRSPIIRSMRRYSLTWYFLLAYSFSWISICILAIIFHYPAGLAGFLVPSIGPALTALVMTSAIEGKGGIGRLLHRYHFWQVGFSWYVFALVVIPALLMLEIIVASHVLAKVHTQTSPLIIGTDYVIYLLIGSFVGELGWRGFALPRMQQYHGTLTGSVFLGLFWGCWYLPLFVFPSFAATMRELGVGNIGQFLLGTITFTIVITWVFNKTQGNLLLTFLLVVSFNPISCFFLSHLLPFPIVVNHDLSILITSGGIALLIIGFTRGHLSYQRYYEEVIRPTIQTSTQDSEDKKNSINELLQKIRVQRLQDLSTNEPSINWSWSSLAARASAANKFPLDDFRATATAFSQVTGVLGGFCIAILVFLFTDTSLSDPNVKVWSMSLLLLAAFLYVAASSFLANSMNALILININLQAKAFTLGIVLFHLANLLLDGVLSFLVCHFLHSLVFLIVAAFIAIVVVIAALINFGILQYLCLYLRKLVRWYIQSGI